ncbi:MAG: hypothetical protein KBA46_05210 [Candidatus Omnitrophica bacterium]|nr:hypothetical protein [Candidatus Omnitrophota bacterium]
MVEKITLMMVVVSVVVSCCAAENCFAQASVKKEKVIKQTVSPKELVGEISSIDKRYIAVVFKQDLAGGSEEEILLPVHDKSLKLDHVQDLTGLQQGDTVRIQYDQEMTDFDSGRKESALKTKRIGLIKKGKPLQRPVGFSDPEGIFRSGE